MAISIGDALLKIGVDKKDFDKGMTGIGASLKKHQKAIGIGMVAMGAAIVGVATKSVLSFAAMGDEIAKMAKRTGFATESLSELRHAAELSGASLAGIEKASRTLSGAILDAGYGLETYTRAFEQIGLSYEDLAKLSPEDQFLKVMEALADVEDETVRAAIATDLFGRAGTQLLPMLSDGAEGLKEMRQEAHDLGIVFDAEAAVAAEELTDAMTRVKSSLTGAGLAIAEALVPVITPLIDKVTEIIETMGIWIGENETLTKVITGAGGLLIGLGGLLLILPKLKAAVLALSGALKTLLFNPIVALITGIGLLGLGIYSLIKHHTDWNRIVDAATNYNDALVRSQGKVTQEVLDASEAYVDLREAYGQLTPEEESHIERLKEMIGLYDDGTLKVEEYTASLGVLRYTHETFKDMVVGSSLEMTHAIWGLTGISKDYADMVIEKYTDVVEVTEKVNEELERELELRRELLGLIAEAYPKGLTMAELQLVAPIIGGVTVPGQVPGTPGYYEALGVAGFQTANITVEVDGKTLARAIGQPLVDEIRLRTGVRM